MPHWQTSQQLVALAGYQPDTRGNMDLQSAVARAEAELARRDWTALTAAKRDEERQYRRHIRPCTPLDCLLSLEVWARRSTATGVLGLLLAYYDTYDGRIVVTE